MGLRVQTLHISKKGWCPDELLEGHLYALKGPGCYESLLPVAMGQLVPALPLEGLEAEVGHKSI